MNERGQNNRTPISAAFEQASKICDTVAGPGAAMEARRTWDECGLEEKVERMRRVTMQARDLAQAAYTAAREALELAKVHQHGHDGQVLKPAEDHRNWQGLVSGSNFDPLR